jgi:hypothetical protein
MIRELKSQRCRSVMMVTLLGTVLRVILESYRSVLKLPLVVEAVAQIPFALGTSSSVATRAASALVYGFPTTSISLLAIGFLMRRAARNTPVGRCRSCGYSLQGIPEPRCPECGVSAYNAVEATETSVHWISQCFVVTGTALLVVVLEPVLLILSTQIFGEVQLEVKLREILNWLGLGVLADIRVHSIGVYAFPAMAICLFIYARSGWWAQEGGKAR